MKLFENGVGRPSNEIKKKRKIFIASAIVLCIALVSVFAITLTKVDTNMTKGATKKLTLNCPTTVAVNQGFICTTNIEGATIRGSYANELAKGYKISSVTSKNNMTHSFMYTKARNAVYVVVEKKGYKAVQKKIKIENKLILNCPTTVAVNQGFICTTNIEGATIRGSYANELAKGQKISGLTTKENLLHNFKYTKARNNLYIAVEKKGYKTVKKKIIVEDKLILSCPTSVAVNQEFKCTTNIEGATIRGSYANELANGYKISGVVSKENLSHTFKYSKPRNTLYVAVEKNGYKKVQKKIKVEDKLILNCPSKVAINEEFKCSTNMEEASITMLHPKVLAQGYVDSVMKKGSPTVAEYMVIEPNMTIKVKVSKEGYKEVIKEIKTYRKESSSTKKLVIKCDDSKTIGYGVRCTVNDEKGAVVKDATVTVADSKIATVNKDGDIYYIVFNNVLFEKYGSSKKYDSKLKKYYINSLIKVSKSGYPTAVTYSKIYEADKK